MQLLGSPKIISANCLISFLCNGHCQNDASLFAKLQIINEKTIQHHTILSVTTGGVAFTAPRRIDRMDHRNLCRLVEWRHLQKQSAAFEIKEDVVLSSPDNPCDFIHKC